MISKAAVRALEEILERGNTAEIKRTRDGVLILESQKKVRYRGDGTAEPAENDTDRSRE